MAIRLEDLPEIPSGRVLKMEVEWDSFEIAEAGTERIRNRHTVFMTPEAMQMSRQAKKFIAYGERKDGNYDNLRIMEPLDLSLKYLAIE